MIVSVMKKFCWIFFALISMYMHMYALSPNKKEIMHIYHNVVYNNEVNIDDLEYLKSISDEELLSYTDSVQYCFHY